jgi:TonB family protein
MASVGVHAAVAWLAVAATVRADEGPPADPPPPLVYVPLAPSREAGRATSAVGARTAPRARGTRAAPASRTVPPVALAPFDLSAVEPGGVGAPLVDATELAASGEGAGAGGGGGGGAPTAGVWTGPAVEIAAAPRPGNPPPRYPAALEAGRTPGRVEARFVVDTLGRVEAGSVEIAGATDSRFAAAVRRVLGGYRFTPARVRGRPVRQLVELPFHFEPPR